MTEELYDSDQLGQPDLELAGFRLWVHKWEFPSHEDGWVVVTANCRAPGADIWTSGPILAAYSFVRWLRTCERLHQKLQGEAILGSDEPNLIVILRPEGSTGRITMEVSITADLEDQSHNLTYHMDQSYLPPVLEQTRKILLSYPDPG